MATHIDWPKGPTRWIEDRVLYVSVPFTWDLPKVVEEVKNPGLYWDSVVVGGPAVYTLPHMFDGIPHVTIRNSYPGVLQKVNPMATKTTTGCCRACPWCIVRKMEGPLQELDDWPDLPVLTDNNLLGASLEHFDRVIDRLVKWGWCDFNQGLDTRLLTPYHAKRIAEIKHPTVKVALDDMSYAKEWELATKLLMEAGVARANIRTLVLIGFNTGPEEAWERCRFIQSKGQNPRPMWFHELTSLSLRTITPKQQNLGWTHAERVKITGYWYAGRGWENLPHNQERLRRKTFWYFKELEL